MSDDINVNAGQDEDEDDILKILGISEKDDEGDGSDDDAGKYDHLQDEQDEKDDRMARKLLKKAEEMNKQFEQTILAERAKAFQSGASDLAKDLFKTIAADVKSVAEFDRAVGLIQKREAELAQQEQAYREQAEARAAEQASRAWGTGPLGTPRPKVTKDAADELFNKVNTGKASVKETMEFLIGDDWPQSVFSD